MIYLISKELIRLNLNRVNWSMRNWERSHPFSNIANFKTGTTTWVSNSGHIPLPSSNPLQILSNTPQTLSNSSNITTL